MTNSISYSFKPGVHSHNASRTFVRPAGPPRRVRNLLIVIGILCLGYFAYTWANQAIYQVYENWALTQERAQAHPAESMPVPAPVPADGSVIGRVRIGRLHLSAIVRQGVDEGTLKEAVGHVPSTALPGQAGNFAIAAHRDTLFRALKDIKLGDSITFESPSSQFQYQVVATKIVKPTDVSVLRPDGGGLIPELNGPESNGAAKPKLLTMITCYPFYYVGAAPERFIVEAKLVDDKTPMVN
jgi:sortase A